MAATAMSVTHMEVMVPMAMKASTMRSVRRPTLVSIHSMKRRARPEDVMAAERPMAPMRNSSTLLPKPNVTSLSKLATPKICRNTIRQRDPLDDREAKDGHNDLGIRCKRNGFLALIEG